MNTKTQASYTALAIVLHWAIAIAIALMIPLGWWMGDALEQPGARAQAAAAFQLHKSVGLTILALSLVRLAWRLAHPPPPLPAHMPRWERVAATVTHWGFYALIIAMPLTGWLYVSTGWSAPQDRALEVPTLFFGLFQVPHLFDLDQLHTAARAGVSENLEFAHSKLAWGAIGLTALHVAAALKHQFLDRDHLLARMLPFLGGDKKSQARPARLAVFAIGAAATLAMLGLCLFLFFNPPASTTAPPRAAPPMAAPTEAENIQATEPETSIPDTSAEVQLAEQATQSQTSTEPAPPPAWRVDHAASAISYAGSHLDVPFEGRFQRWRADIRFDPDNLAASSAEVTIETGSARDGVPLHDETLPEPEWFDIDNHPNARFLARSFARRGDNAYVARGTLTIKGRDLPVDLPFTLAITGARATMNGALAIDRAAADLGQQSDPDGDFVSTTIDVRIHLEAERAP